MILFIFSYESVWKTQINAVVLFEKDELVNLKYE